MLAFLCYGMLCGNRSLVAIAELGRAHEAWPQDHERGVAIQWIIMPADFPSMVVRLVTRTDIQGA